MNKLVTIICLALLCHVQLRSQISFEIRNDLLQEKDMHSAVPVGIADMNGDGLDDIVTLHNGHILYIQYQTPDPNRPFVRYEVSRNVDVAEQNDLCIADYDNDGTNDIMICGSYDKVKMYYGNKGSYHFTQQNILGLSFFSQGASAGDFNQDGWVDVVLLNDNAANFTLINDGTGNLVKTDYFDFVTIPASDNSGNYGSVYSDFDMDGDLDLYIAKCRQGVNDPTDPRRINILFVNDGAGNYTQSANQYGLAIGHQTWTADFGDMDNDGDLDCFMTQHDVISELYENIDNDTFINITPGTGLNIGGVTLQGMFVDFDNDGYLDILTSGDRTEFYHNNGDKTFSRETPFGTEVIGTFALGDLNHDGFVDMYASRVIPFNNPDPAREDLLYINKSNSNHFLALQLENAPDTNRSAIGAMALLYGPWGVQIREVRGGEEYGVSNSHHLIFGLGQETSYDSLIIRWPGGVRNRYNDLSVDRYWKLTYGGCYSSSLSMFDPLAVLCNNDSLILRNSSAMAVNSWSTGQTSDSIIIADAGLYYLTLVDQDNCTVRTAPIEVTTDPDSIKPTLYFEGNTTLCNGDQVEITVSTGESYEWSSGETTQTIYATSSGIYYAEVQGFCKTQLSDSVSLTFIVPDSPVVTGDTVDPGDPALLIAAGDSIVWYSDPNGLNVVGSGSTITLDNLADTTTLYAANLNPLAGVDYETGQVSHTGSTKYNATFVNGGLIFDVLEPVVIHQVTAITDSIGERVIEIVDGASFLFQKTVNLEAGTNIIDLDVALPVGNYTISTSTTKNLDVFGVNSPYLWRSSEGVFYPYEIPGVLSIVNSTYGSSFYYYFYDWKFSTQDRYCESELVPVTAYVDFNSAVDPVLNARSLQLYPNPTDENINLVAPESGKIELALYTINGQEVYQFSGVVSKNQQLSMETNSFTPGIYTVKLIQGQKAYLGKFVKMN